MRKKCIWVLLTGEEGRRKTIFIKLPFSPAGYISRMWAACQLADTSDLPLDCLHSAVAVPAFSECTCNKVPWHLKVNTLRKKRLNDLNSHNLSPTVLLGMKNAEQHNWEKSHCDFFFFDRSLSFWDDVFLELRTSFLPSYFHFHRKYSLVRDPICDCTGFYEKYN